MSTWARLAHAAKVGIECASRARREDVREAVGAGDGRAWTSDLADGVVAVVRNIDVRRRVEGDSTWVTKRRRRACPVFKSKRAIQPPSERRDDADGVDLADGVVVGVRYIDV